MPLERELARLSPEKGTLIAIGVFDGVHLGHKQLISQLIKNARKQKLLSGVLTFRQHPLEILSPETQFAYLTTADEKINLLRNEGVDIVIALSFTTEIARLNARRFVSLLMKHLKMRGLVIGPNFTLGHNREGNTDTIGNLGDELGFSLTVISPIMVDGEVVSSTLIRKALTEGNIKKATRLIGRPVSLFGAVISGEGRGVGLGFPTANLEVHSNQALPADGIYATRIYLDSKTYPAVTNIGQNPTFGDNERSVETYIINYQGNLYGRELKIDIIERLREEKKFDSVEELKKQIADDVERGQTILNSR
jgi:riboflavin kinase/FMN adenylyltransferase